MAGHPFSSWIFSIQDYKAGMCCACILQSVNNPRETYRGHTDDLKQRLVEHNGGKCPHTSKFKPWKIKFYAAFETLELAQQFEHYLKSGSGHAFAKRHFGC
jgi:putative endonuclease